jgi:hypothetical protein
MSAFVGLVNMLWFVASHRGHPNPIMLDRGVYLHMAGEFRGMPVFCETFPVCSIPMADLTVRLYIFNVENTLAK